MPAVAAMRADPAFAGPTRVPTVPSRRPTRRPSAPAALPVNACGMSRRMCPGC